MGGQAQDASLTAALRATAPDLLTYFERRTTSREDAADLLGETMLQAWRRVDRLPDNPERQRMWLFTIAANVLANGRRTFRRRRALTDRLRQTLRPTSAPDPAEHSEVRDAVMHLHRAQQELVMLIHWDGFGIADAAEILGLNPSTARNHYATARKALKDALAEEALIQPPSMM